MGVPIQRPIHRLGRGVASAAFLVAVCLATSASAGTTVRMPGATESENPLPALRLNPPDRRVLLGFVGDIHVHRRVNRSAQRSVGFDYHPMFQRVRQLLEHIDLAVCHLEQPFAPPGQPVIVEPPLLSSAPQLAQALSRAGFDRCGTASNHAMDRGTQGIDFTLATMDAAGLSHSGTARTPDEAVAEVFEVNGVRIAQLAYTFGSNRGAPPGQRWRVNTTNPITIVSDARRARSDGAELVVVTIEWGVDKVVEPTADQRRIAAAITASGDIDLIVGYQAHVIQPISMVNGTWVVWGMGNFLSDHPVDRTWPSNSQDGAIFTVDVSVDGTGRATVQKPQVVPTWCDRTGGHVILPTSLAHDGVLPAWKRQQLAASAARTARVVGGHIAPGA